MKTRSSVEICAPLLVFMGACALSVPTLVIAISWMTLGVCCLGYRTLSDFPDEGVPQKWKRGVRGACLLFYHLAWWPWYMRRELHVFVIHSRKFLSGKWSRTRGVRARQGGNGKDR